MANVNKPSGLSPSQYLNGSPWNGQARIYSIDAAYGTALAIGDPVVSGGGADGNGVPNITIATAGAANPVRGVIVGLGKYEGGIFNPNNLDQIYRPASDPAVWYALVVDDPNVLFEVQEYGVTGTSLAATDVGANVNLKSGTNNGYVSGWTLDNTVTPTTTATIQCRIMGLVRRGDNVIGQYSKWLVKINNHELAAGTAGI